MTEPAPEPKITPLPATGRTPQRWPAAECAEEWNETLVRIRCGGALPVRFYAEPAPTGGMVIVTEMDVPDVREVEDLRPRYQYDDALGHGKARVLLHIITISKRTAVPVGRWTPAEIVLWAHETARWMYRHEADEQFRVIRHPDDDGGERRPFEPTKEHGHA